MSNGTDQRPEQLSSVQLTRNAKGGIQPEVKVYGADPQQAAEQAQQIFNDLCAQYPFVG